MSACQADSRQSILPHLTFCVWSGGEEGNPESREGCGIRCSLCNRLPRSTLTWAHPGPSLRPLSAWPGLAASQVPGHPHPATEEPLSFRVLQTSSFANSSWASSQGSGWLGELQTHGWDNALGTISFLQPWSRGNFSAEELRNLQNLFRLYFHGFIIEVRAFEHQFQFECEFLVPCRYSPEGSSLLPKGL